MNYFKRGMIFVTFFGSLISIALLVASLGTKYWVNAAAKRSTNPHESDGKIHFGLFDGKKELNVAYGWRTYEVDGRFIRDTVIHTVGDKIYICSSRTNTRTPSNNIVKIET